MLSSGNTAKGWYFMLSPYVKGRLNPIIRNMLSYQLERYEQFLNDDYLMTNRRANYLLKIGAAKLEIVEGVDREKLIIGLAYELGYI